MAAGDQKDSGGGGDADDRRGAAGMRIALVLAQSAMPAIADLRTDNLGAPRIEPYPPGIWTTLRAGRPYVETALLAARWHALPSDPADPDRQR